MINRSIKKIAVTIGLFHCFRLLTGPINVIYLISQELNLQGIAKLQIIYCITSLLVNYPIGVISDIYSNKILTIIGISISSLHYLFYFFFDVKFLVLAQIVLAIGLSLIDVNSSSWIAKEVKIDNLKKYNIDYYSHLEEEIRSFYGFFITIFFCLSALFVPGRIFYKAVYICTFILILISSFFVFKIKETKVSRKNINLYQIKKNSLLSNNAFFVIFIILSGLIWGSYQSLFNYWQPLLASKQFNLPYLFSCNINFIMGVSFLTSNFSVYFFNKIFKKVALRISDFYLLGGCFALLGAILFLAIGILLPSILSCIMGFGTLHGCMSVLWKLVRNQCLKMGNTKTYGKLISASNLFCKIVGLIISLLFAKILRIEGVEILFIICSGIMFLAFLFFLVWRYTARIVQYQTTPQQKID